MDSTGNYRFEDEDGDPLKVVADADRVTLETARDLLIFEPDKAVEIAIAILRCATLAKR